MKYIFLFLMMCFMGSSGYSQVFLEETLIKDSVLSKQKGKDIYRIKGFAVKDTALVEMGIKDKNLFPILDSIMAYEPNCKYYTDSLSYSIYVYKVQGTVEVLITSLPNPSTILNGFYAGCFIYKNKEFGIWGNSWNALFFKKENYMKFPYRVYYPTIGDEESIWAYQYIDEKFVLQTYCRCNDEKATNLF